MTWRARAEKAEAEVRALAEALERIATAELWVDSENPNDTPQEIARAVLNRIQEKS